MKRAAKLSPGEMADDVARFASGLATIQDELAGLNRAAQSKGSTRETSEPLPITLTLTAHHPHPHANPTRHPHPHPHPHPQPGAAAETTRSTVEMGCVLSTVESKGDRFKEVMQPFADGVSSQVGSYPYR